MLKKIDVCLVFLACLIIRNVIKGANVGDAIAICGVASLYGYRSYLEIKKVVHVNDEIKKDVSDLKSSVNSLKIARSFTKI